MRILRLVPIIAILAACGSGNESVWNDPYPDAESGSNILYSAFTDRPKHLDPVQSYTEDESVFTANIYEPPLQYHYLKRPYTLISSTVEEVPEPRYFDAGGNPLPADAPAGQIAESVYEFHVRSGIFYAPHPAFARMPDGSPRYAALDREQLKAIERVSDFPETGTRELVADDYIYQIKRLAHPHLHSPIFSTMSERLPGLRTLAEELKQAAKTLPPPGQPGSWLDLDRFPLPGVEKLDRYRYRIHVRGKYPQFLYWQAMHFFAPVPREVDRFYNQPGMAEKNLTLDWYPVGTGPYMLSENDPNRRMTLSRNPNFRGQGYPCEGEVEDRAAGRLDDCGKTVPFIDQAIFTREKESIPYWNKFLQGWYDASGIASDSFDQAVRISVDGDVGLSDEMRARDIHLLTSVRAAVFYMGFNMLDPTVGAQGTSNEARARKLRQALSIAVDQEEYISIFLNGRGVPAMSPLPPGIFGYLEGEAGINPVVYTWREGQARRRPVEEAKKLLAEAGWPNGRDAKTGEPLILYLDTTSGGMGDKARLDWLTRQFSKVGAQLIIRSTDFNRFQEKLRTGAAQIYFLGWNADYPDPENFFFLFDSDGARAKNGGENASNYRNDEFDRLFLQMKGMENTGAQGEERLALIRKMTRILQTDAPWIFCFHPKTYILRHEWLYNRKPSDVGGNGLKYQRIDPERREEKRQQWNMPMLWPLLVVVVLAGGLVGFGVRSYRASRKG
ncbi:MAG: ABC transporter substrate-binding protein [Betaproteobacteria bacterium]|nr:ABC transporter substrate-binding protein [Betaproteobacteria bacterium]